MPKKSFLITIFMAIILSSIMKVTPAFSIIEPGPGEGYATIYISPATNNFISPPAKVGDWFLVEVRIKDYDQVAGYQVRVIYDKSLLDIPTRPPPDYYDVKYAPDHIFPVGTYGVMPASKGSFNATHDYFIRTASTYGLVEYSGSDAGLLVANFTIKKEPDPGKTLSCMLWLQPVDTYTLDENVEENDEERIDGYYEIASSIPPPPPPAAAKITFEPERTVNATLTACNNFNVSVKITNATNVHSLQFKFTFNQTVLNIVDAYPGTFLIGASVTKTINNTEGYIIFGLQLPPLEPPVNGSGTLAIIEFHVESLGESNLEFIETDTWLKDPEGQDLTYEAFDGYFNNMMVPKLAVDPPEIIDPELVPPKTFKINITLAEVEGVYDYEFKLGFDRTVLACLMVEIHDVFGETNYIPQFSVNNALGIVWVRVDYYEPAVPISTLEPVALVTLTFRVKAMGISILDLYETELSDTLGGLIEHEVYDGLFQTLIRDAAIVNVTKDLDSAYEGWKVKINVTIRNEGNLTENIDVLVHYGLDALVGILNFTGVEPDQEATLTIEWNTKGVKPCTNYTIWAETVRLPYETDLSDNSFYDGGVKIKLPGDINGDGMVEGRDVAILSLAFGSYEGGPRWNPDADINRDGKVEGIDVALTAKNYGKSCTP